MRRVIGKVSKCGVWPEPLLWWIRISPEQHKSIPIWEFYIIHWLIAAPIQLALWAILPKHKTKGWW